MGFLPGRVGSAALVEDVRVHGCTHLSIPPTDDGPARLPEDRSKANLERENAGLQSESAAIRRLAHQACVASSAPLCGGSACARPDRWTS
jgi:hypothetical protein